MRVAALTTSYGGYDDSTDHHDGLSACLGSGATCFFTVALARRRKDTLLVDRVGTLRAAFRHVRERHPFHIDAIVILPEHLHCI